MYDNVFNKMPLEIRNLLPAKHRKGKVYYNITNIFLLFDMIHTTYSSYYLNQETYTYYLYTIFDILNLGTKVFNYFLIPR